MLWRNEPYRDLISTVYLVLRNELFMHRNPYIFLAMHKLALFRIHTIFSVL